MSDDVKAELRALLGESFVARVVSARALGSRDLREGPFFAVQVEGEPTRTWQIIERAPSLLDALEPLVRTACEASRDSGSGLWPIERVERVTGPGNIQRVVIVTALAASSLEALVERGETFTPAQVGNVACDLAHGLATLHARGVVHRALRGSTAMVDDQRRAYVADYSRVAATGATGSWPSPELELLALDGGEAGPAMDTALLAAMLHGWLTRRPLERIELGSIDASRIAEHVYGQGATREADYRFAQETAGYIARGLAAGPGAPSPTAVARGVDEAAARLDARRGAMGKLTRAIAVLACTAAALLMLAAGVGVGGRLREDRRSRLLEPGTVANPLRLLIVVPAVSEEATARAHALESAIGAIGGATPLEVRCLVATNYDEAAQMARLCDVAILPFQCYTKSHAVVDPALVVSRRGALHYYSQVVATAPFVEKLTKELVAAGQPAPKWPVRESAELVKMLQTYIDRVDRSAALGTVHWAYGQAESGAGRVVFDLAVARKLDTNRLLAVESGSYAQSMELLRANEVEMATFVAASGQDTNLELLATLYLKGDVAKLEGLTQIAILTDRRIPNDVVAFRKDFDPLSRSRIEKLLLSLGAHDAVPAVRDAIWKALSITGLEKIGSEQRQLIDDWTAWTKDPR